MLTAFATAIAGLLGAAIGSFLNVVVYRVPLGLSIVKPASSCPGCGTPIRPVDNVPVVSYAVLRGKCRHCGVKISARYPMIEALNAVLWVAAALRFGATEIAAFVALAGSVLVALAAIDLEHRRLPNVIVLPATAGAAVWVVAAAALKSEWGLAGDAFLGGAAAFGVLFVIALVSGGMGFGDVKLAAFIGLVAGRFGFSVAVVAVMASFMIGGLVATSLLVLGRKGRKDAVPFGPSLAAGGLLAAFAGPEIVRAWLGA